MGKANRDSALGCLLLLILAAGLIAWFAWDYLPGARYNRRSRQINEKIHALDARRPDDVSPRVWSECVAWASTAHCNICFSDEHASYEAMLRFEDQLDEKLKGPVDLDTIAWIGQRLAETGPHGQQYMNKWEKQWESIIEWAREEGED